MKNLSIMLTLSLLLMGCQNAESEKQGSEEKPEHNLPRQIDIEIHKDFDSFQKCPEELLHRIPSAEKLFSKEDFADKINTVELFYDDIDTTQDFFIINNYKFQDYTLVLVASTFGAYFNKPCRIKLFVFKGDKFMDAKCVSGLLADGGEYLKYSSIIDQSEDAINIKRTIEYHYEDILSVDSSSQRDTSFSQTMVINKGKFELE